MRHTHAGHEFLGSHHGQEVRFFLPHELLAALDVHGFAETGELYEHQLLADGPGAGVFEVRVLLEDLNGFVDVHQSIGQVAVAIPDARYRHSGGQGGGCYGGCAAVAASFRSRRRFVLSAGFSGPLRGVDGCGGDVFHVQSRRRSDEQTVAPLGLTATLHQQRNTAV